MSPAIHRFLVATWTHAWPVQSAIILVALAAGPSQAQDTASSNTGRERILRASANNPAPVPKPTENHNHCLVPSKDYRGSYLENRCSYRINAMYCHLRDSTPSGCQAQTISLSNGVTSRITPWPFNKFRWLACRSPSYPTESRWHDGIRIRVEWICTN